MVYRGRVPAHNGCPSKRAARTVGVGAIVGAMFSQSSFRHSSSSASSRLINAWRRRWTRVTERGESSVARPLVMLGVDGRDVVVDARDVLGGSAAVAAVAVEGTAWISLGKLVLGVLGSGVSRTGKAAWSWRTRLTSPSGIAWARLRLGAGGCGHGHGRVSE